MRIAVQENARSAGKAPGTTSGAVGIPVLAAFAFAFAPAQAQIAGDPNAPGNQRPTVLAAPNGVPVINIVTPSAAGVSRNVYRQFDVNASGAIFNNSRTPVQSQLGGFLAANPWLANGSARIILNEVNSSSPSYLRGPLEVAGSRAEIVIANPSGIQVDGATFINANRVTLTTGAPQLNAYGGIESYRVTGGTIGVSGAGLNASGTEFAALYARMVSINAGVWGGGELRVVTGANQVGADSAPGAAANVAPIAGTGPTPPLAFDSGTLGGMYAQKIWIMGTEAGVGARNAGTIQTGAGNAALMGIGELTVTASGRIENIGTIQAAGDAIIAAPSFTNSGTVLSVGATKISSTGDLTNSGTLEGQRIELASAAGDVVNSGTLRQNGAAGLTLAAPILNNTAGAVIGAEPAPAAPSPNEPSSGNENTGGDPADAGGAGGPGTPGNAGQGAPNTPPSPGSSPPAPGSITAANGKIRNEGGRIYAGGPITLQTPQVNNSGGQLDIGTLTVSGPAFSNAGGVLNVANNFTADVGTFDNGAGGKLHAGSVTITTSGDLNNQDGSIESNGDVVLEVGGATNNMRGAISAAGALNARVAGDVQNSAGSLVANQAVTLSGKSLDNTQGAISSATAGVSVNVSNALTNSGQIGAATDLSIRAGSVSNSGTLRGTNDTAIRVAGQLSTDGSITAGRNTTIDAASLRAGTGSVLGAGINADGSLAATGDLHVTTTGALVAQGQNLAASVTLQGASVDLSDSTTSAANIAISATQGEVATSRATVVTPGTLTVTANNLAAQALVNDGGQINAGQLDLRVSNIVNTNGAELVQTGAASSTIAVAGSLDNSNGLIASNGQDLALSAGRIINTTGEIHHAGAGALSINGGIFDGAGGSVLSNGALAINVAGAFKQDGGTTSAQQLAIDAGSFSNKSGTVTQTGEGATRISVAGDLDNSAGSISTNGADFMLGADAVVNTQGRLEHAGAGTLALKARTFSGAGGALLSNGRVDIKAGRFEQDGGSMAAQQISIAATDLSNRAGSIVQSGAEATDITVTGTFDNSAGRLATNGGDLRLNLQGATLVNSGGAIEHAGAGTLLLNAATYRANDGQITSNGVLSARVGNFAQAGGATVAQQVSIDAAALSNTLGAQIVQSGAGTTRIAVSGPLTNDGGLIASNGSDVAIEAGTLSNAAGQILHAGAGTLALTAGSLQGPGGEITSNGALVAQVMGDFNQDGGAATAKQITIDAGSLGNRGGTIVQTGTDAMRITVGGALDNSNGGSIASNGATTLSALSLDNRAGSIRTAGTADLDVSTAGVADNSAAGLITSGGGATIHAGSLVNDSGRITAVGDLAAAVTGTATNVGGMLAANGDTTVTAASLDNTQGTVAAVLGDLDVTTSGSTRNTSGTLQAGGSVALANAGLDNTLGKVFANALSIDTNGVALTNAQGTIAAATTVAVHSGALANDAGLIQSGGAMTIDTNGQALSNTNAAAHASGQGGITSADTLTIATGALTNTGGFIGSKNALTANTGSFTNNGGGVVLAQSSVSIDTHGATYDNAGGQTQAVGDLTVSAGHVANSGGLIRSAATTALDAASISNANTLGADQGIEGGNVVINVANLDNTSGAIRSDGTVGNTTVTSGGSVNNTNGLISAGNRLAIADPNAATPGAKTLSITNTGGTLTANNDLRLDAATFSADGSVASGWDLSIALTQDLVNNGEVSAKGDLTYKTTGNLTNNGKLLAGGTLNAGGAVVENTANAEMSGTDTFIQAAALNNRGLIDSQGQTRIDANAVNNIGTGRIYGDAVAIGAGTLNNVSETLNGTASAATIAGRSTLDIGADSINNRDGALLFSAGDMFIGARLDANGYATGKGSVLNNESASIESLGDMSIAMTKVNNIDTHLKVVQQTTTEQDHYLVTTADQKRWSLADTRGDPLTGFVWHRNPDGTESLVGIGYGDWTATVTTTSDVATNAAPARLVAGGDMNIEGQLFNRDSKVTAGGALNAPGATNEATKGTSTTSLSNITVIGCDGSGGCAPFPVAPFSNPPQTIDVGAYEYTHDTNATLGYNAGSAPGVNAPGGSAGSTGSVSAGGANGPGTVIEVPSAVNGSAAASGNAAAPVADQAAGAAGADPAGSASGTTPGAAGAVDAAGQSGSSRSIPMVVRTSTPETRLPTASLFRTQPGATAHYLIETDPRFADYRQWLSSDYLLNALGFNPDTVQKRLGDGFYEQQLIREQIAQLTGYRYLDGYTSDQDEYTALMNAGVTFAKQYGLTPGIALTAAQMAQLTSDIVWLVEQTVTLADGSTQQVLVPQVYVRVQPGDIDGSGALLSADRLNIKNKAGEGDFTNSGTVAGRSLVSITADNIDNLGGRISGGNVALDARNDINVIGGTVDARDALSLKAGNDINVRTTTSSATGALTSSTVIDRVAGLYVTNPGGTLVASAGRDVNLVGAIIENQGGGSTSITAKRDINLGTVTESRSHLAVTGPKDYVGSATSRETGTTITTHGTTVLSAGNDINARQATVSSGDGLLLVHADRDINIGAGQTTQLDIQGKQTTTKGTFKKSTTTTNSSAESTTSVGSSFSGGTVAMTANNDITIEGSHISGTNGVLVDAGRNLTVYEGRNTSSASLETDTQTRGIGFGGGSLPIVGPVKKGSGTGIEVSSNTASASTIQSSQGGVLLQGGGTVTLQGVQVDAAKDITIHGGNVDIHAAVDGQSLAIAHKSNDLNLGSETWYRDPSTGFNAKMAQEAGISDTSLARTTLNGANVNITADDTLAMAGTTVSTPGELSLKADTLVLGTQATEHGTQETSQGRDLMYQKAKDKGTTDQTTNYNQFNAGSLAVSANHVQAGVGARDSIEQLAQLPGMGWIEQLQNDPNLSGKVDWAKVEEAHKDWNYSQQGLTPEGAAIVTVVVSYFSWGAANGAGTAAGGAVGGGTTGAVVGGAVTAGVSALAGQASVALINNQGDIGKALDELGSSSNVKNLLTAIATGGVLGGLNLNPTGLPTVRGGAQPFIDQLGQNLAAGAAKAVIGTAINGGSFERNLAEGLKGAFLDTVAAQGAFAIGRNIEPGSIANALAHAIAGCAVGAARTDGSCGASALGAAIGELAAGLYDPSALNQQGDTVQFAAMVSGIAGAVAGLDAAEINQASQAGANSAANNWLATKQVAQAKQELAAAKTPLEALQTAAKWAAIGVKQDVLTASGIGLGLADAGLSDIQALGEFLAHPIEGLNGLRQIINSPELREQLGDKTFAELDAKLDRMAIALTDGGDQNAVQLGQDLGNLIWQVGAVLTGADAVAKGGVALANVAVKVGTGALDVAQGLGAANAAATAAADASVPAMSYLGVQARVSELAALFSKQVAIEEISLGGKAYTATAESNKAGTTKVFNTTSVSDAQLEAQAKAYVNDLTGGAPLVPVAGDPPNVWSVTTRDGTTINLRTVSNSQIGASGRNARWTVDVKDNPQVSAVAPRDRVEIKFK